MLGSNGSKSSKDMSTLAEELSTILGSTKEKKHITTAKPSPLDNIALPYDDEKHDQVLNQLQSHIYSMHEQFKNFVKETENMKRQKYELLKQENQQLYNMLEDLQTRNQKLSSEICELDKLCCRDHNVPCHSPRGNSRQECYNQIEEDNMHLLQFVNTLQAEKEKLEVQRDELIATMHEFEKQIVTMKDILKTMSKERQQYSKLYEKHHEQTARFQRKQTKYEEVRNAAMQCMKQTETLSADNQKVHQKLGEQSAEIQRLKQKLKDLNRDNKSKSSPQALEPIKINPAGMSYVSVVLGEIGHVPCDTWMVAISSDDIKISSPLLSSSPFLKECDIKLSLKLDKSTKIYPVEGCPDYQPLPYMAYITENDSMNQICLVARQYFDTVGADLIKWPRRPKCGRQRHLVTLPLLGAGHATKLSILKHMFPIMSECCAKYNYDIGVVIPEGTDYAAAHAARVMFS